MKMLDARKLYKSCTTLLWVVSPCPL